MPNIGDLLRDSAIGKAMFSARYGEQDPYALAIEHAAELGYPAPGAKDDKGQAQRYQASRLAADRFGVLPLLTNPLHEAVMSWAAEGEGKPSIDRLIAGYRGAFDSLEAPPAAPAPVRPGYGLQGAQIQPSNEGVLPRIADLLASVSAR